jgi:hypothetical protein
VTANKIELELSQSIVRDANVGQFAKTRADAVNDIVARNDIFEETFTGASPSATVAISASVNFWPCNSIRRF